MRLSGSVAIITGAGGGIGAALARRFDAEGVAGLCLADINEEAVTAVAAELSGPVISIRTDVADEAQVRAMVDATVAELGPVDLVCSNAGIATGLGFEAPDETWEAAWSVNVRAHVYAARAVIPDMLARGHGYLLNTCSAAGLLTQ